MTRHGRRRVQLSIGIRPGIQLSIGWTDARRLISSHIGSDAGPSTRGAFVISQNPTSCLREPTSASRALLRTDELGAAKDGTL
jgi:hypothetical protein